MGIRRSNKVLRNIARIGKTRIGRASSLYSAPALFSFLVFSIFASIFFSALIYSNTFADSYINLTSSGDVNINAVRMNPASLTIGKNIVSVDTDSPYGYHIYISAPSEETDGFSPLELTSDNTVKLLGLNFTTPVAFSSSSDYANMWGFAVPSDNLSSGSTTSSFSPSASYEALIGTGGTANASIIGSLTWQGAKNEEQEIYTSTDDTNVDLSIYYGVYVDDTAEEGTYTNTVTYTAVVEGPGSLVDGMTMQEASGVACDNTPLDTTIGLIDERTGKSYLVAKMKDGNCWMVQNLWMSGSSEYITQSGNFYTTPASNASAGAWPSSNDTSGRMYEGFGHTDNTYDSRSNSGSYFNWLAATAGSGNNVGETTLVSPLPDDKNVASDSICPQGWKLPTGGSYGESTDDYNIAFSYYENDALTFLHAGPTDYCSSTNGCVSVSESHQYVGAYWWGSRQYTDTYINHISTYGVWRDYNWRRIALNYNSKTHGFSVRCLLSTKSFDYSVTFADNGGAGGPGTMSGTASKGTIQLKPQKPTREGYTFLGWARTADATKAAYPVGSPVIVSSTNASMTLYAVWISI